MIVLRQTRSWYGQEDTGLTDRLLGELPGILLWAIAGWQRLRERGRFQQPESALQLVEGLEDLSSPIAAFVRERCEVGPGYEARVKACSSCGKHGARRRAAATAPTPVSAATCTPPCPTSTTAGPATERTGCECTSASGSLSRFLISKGGERGFGPRWSAMVHGPDHRRAIRAKVQGNRGRVWSLLRTGLVRSMDHRGPALAAALASAGESCPAARPRARGDGRAGPARTPAAEREAAEAATPPAEATEDTGARPACLPVIDGRTPRPAAGAVATGRARTADARLEARSSRVACRAGNASTATGESRCRHGRPRPRTNGGRRRAPRRRRSESNNGGEELSWRRKRNSTRPSTSGRTRSRRRARPRRRAPPSPMPGAPTS